MNRLGGHDIWAIEVSQVASIYFSTRRLNQFGTGVDSGLGMLQGEINNRMRSRGVKSGS
jgi:hypothetical protein